MNTPNPLIPQGSLLEQQKTKGKSNLFIAVFTILAIHVVLFAGLLMQGCKQNKTPKTDEMGLIPPPATQTESNSLAMPPSLPAPPLTSNETAAFTPDTNALPPVGTISNPVPSIIPTPAPLTSEPASIAPPATGKEYTVVKGDLFYKIAKAHGISVSALTKANPNADPRKLKVGQKLIIPTPEPTEATTTTPTASGTEPAATKGTTKVSKAVSTSAYTVKAGDTLAKIARTHGTTIKALRSLNALKTDQLHPGQKLKLPAHKAAAAAEPATTESAAPAKI
jgi:LysM repeat protein